jgi:hypothetical protein
VKKRSPPALVTTASVTTGDSLSMTARNNFRLPSWGGRGCKEDNSRASGGLQWSGRVPSHMAAGCSLRPAAPRPSMTPLWARRPPARRARPCACRCTNPPCAASPCRAGETGVWAGAALAGNTRPLYVWHSRAARIQWVRASKGHERMARSSSTANCKRRGQARPRHTGNRRLTLTPAGLAPPAPRRARAARQTVAPAQRRAGGARGCRDSGCRRAGGGGAREQAGRRAIEASGTTGC